MAATPVAATPATTAAAATPAAAATTPAAAAATTPAAATPAAATPAAAAQQQKPAAAQKQKQGQQQKPTVPTKNTIEGFDNFKRYAFTKLGKRIGQFKAGFSHNKNIIKVDLGPLFNKLLEQYYDKKDKLFYFKEFETFAANTVNPEYIKDIKSYSSPERQLQVERYTNYLKDTYLSKTGGYYEDSDEE